MFQGRKIVIATMHKKEQVIAPILEKNLGVEVVVPKNFNSDKFGTFTREIKRVGDQLEAARKKLLAAMDMEEIDLGVSSEGSFDTDPSMPFIKSNLELVLLIDKRNNLEIKGFYRTPETNADGAYVKNTDEAFEFARQIGFPNHGVIVRKKENDKSKIYKNIHSEEELAALVKKLFESPFTKKIFIETDMRAHRNPTRMKAIEKATENLVKNIFSVCPACQAPGFVVFDIEKGLPCATCGLPTELFKTEIYLCSKCGYKEKKQIATAEADPEYCSHCNP